MAQAECPDGWRSSDAYLLGAVALNYLKETHMAVSLHPAFDSRSGPRKPILLSGLSLAMFTFGLLSLR
jgi:hypothetical protein